MRPLIDVAADLAFEYRIGSTDDEGAGIASYRITILQALTRCDQWVVVILFSGVTPTRRIRLETFVDTCIE
ncbi:hypothetical protein D3C78_1905960 [compost metagenome]